MIFLRGTSSTAVALNCYSPPQQYSYSPFLKAPLRFCQLRLLLKFFVWVFELCILGYQQKEKAVCRSHTSMSTESKCSLTFHPSKRLILSTYQLPTVFFRPVNNNPLQKSNCVKEVLPGHEQLKNSRLYLQIDKVDLKNNVSCLLRLVSVCLFLNENLA